MEEDKSTKFSPSKLGVYRNCPKRYQYRYVDKISRARKTPETVLGVAVHSAFETLYERVTGGQTPSLAQIQEWYEAAFEEGWDSTVVVKDPSFSKEDWKRVGTGCVALYHAANAPFTADRTVAVEKRVGFPIAVDGHEYRIEGFVDRLALAADGAFEIVDYKTAKSLPNQEHADADWQLALYELAIRREWPDAKDVRLKWHYVRHGKTLVSVRDPEARERLLAEATALISAIKRDHEFKTNKGPLCDWCEYRDLCPEFAHPVKVAAMAPEERKKDDGVRLVADYAAIEERRKRVKDELKAVELEKDEVERKLADWAQAAGVSTVAGERAQASVTVKDEIHMPTKTGEAEKHAELEAEVRGSALWGEVARLDTHALLDGLKARKWKGDLLALAESLVERYGRPLTKRVVRLKKRADPEED